MSKKLGDIMKKAPAATVRAEPVAPPPPAPTPAPEQKADAEKEVFLQVLVPLHVRRAIQIRAAEEGTTIRSLILRGVRSLGIEVSDADVGGRRARRS